MARHGHYRSPTYCSWHNMKVRCTWPKHRQFKDYGGRGITVCERWQAFENFLADLGERPAGMTLQRSDKDKGYELGNCGWAPRERSRNRRVRDPSKKAEAKQRFLQSHPAYRAEYRRRSIELQRANLRRYRARQRNAPGELSSNIVEILMQRQRSQCACCRADLQRVGHHLDHIEPLVRGGSNADENVQLLCPPCNYSKSGRDPVEFMQSRGFLL